MVQNYGKLLISSVLVLFFSVLGTPLWAQDDEEDEPIPIVKTDDVIAITTEMQPGTEFSMQVSGGTPEYEGVKKIGTQFTYQLITQQFKILNGVARVNIWPRKKIVAFDSSKSNRLQTIQVKENDLASLIVNSESTYLQEIEIQQNKLRGEAMDRFIESLPDRTQLETAGVVVVVKLDYNDQDELMPVDGEYNVCTKSQVKAMKVKNWIAKSDEGGLMPYTYEGSDDEEDPGEINEKHPKVIINTSLAVGTEFSQKSLVLRSDKNGPGNDYTIDGLEKVGDNYKVTNQRVTIKGPIEDLIALKIGVKTLACEENSVLAKVICPQNELAILDLSAYKAMKSVILNDNKLESFIVSSEADGLKVVNCCNNQLSKEAFSALVTSLPTKSKSAAGDLFAFSKLDTEKNICDKKDLEAALAKNWVVWVHNGFDADKNPTYEKYTIDNSAVALHESTQTEAYPIPAHNVLNIKSQSNVQYRVYTLNGQLVREGMTDATGKAQFGVVSMNKGIYLIQVGENTLRVVVE